MTMLFWKVWRGKSRAPRDFLAKVYAESAEAAIKQVQQQPAYKKLDLALEAVPSHRKKAGK